jgi:hypothetical protein
LAQLLAPRSTSVAPVPTSRAISLAWQSKIACSSRGSEYSGSSQIASNSRAPSAS